MLSIIVNIGVMCLLCCCKTISYDILFVGFIHMYFNWFGCFCVAVEGFVLCVFVVLLLIVFCVLMVLLLFFVLMRS